MLIGKSWEPKFTGRWWTRFAEEHDLKIKRGGGIQLSPPFVSDHAEWMIKWKPLVEKYTRFRIWNMDETGWQRIEASGWYVCGKDAKGVRVAAPVHRDHITMVACVSMTGCHLTPLFLIKGKSELVYESMLTTIGDQKVHVMATGS